MTVYQTGLYSNKGVWFQSDGSGLWYACPSTAEPIRSVKVNGRVFVLQEELSEPFVHTHEDNGVDDVCAACGLDLRNSIHWMPLPKPPEIKRRK